MKITLFLLWILVGILLSFSGCRAALTAEKLEASFAIDRNPPPQITILPPPPRDQIPQ